MNMILKYPSTYRAPAERQTSVLVGVGLLGVGNESTPRIEKPREILRAIYVRLASDGNGKYMYVFEL